MKHSRFDLGNGATQKLLTRLLNQHKLGSNDGADEILAVIATMVSDELDRGALVEQFEAKFAEKIGVAHAVAVGSCTQGLELAIETIKPTEKSEIITTPYAWFGSVNAIINSGAAPRFVDINPETFAMDINALESAINKNTCAILPVYPFGFVPDMDKIYTIVSEHDLWVIEDAAVSLGSKYKGRYVGGFHNNNKGLTVFSFCPTKTMTTGGGGIVTTSNYDAWEEIKMRAYQGNYDAINSNNSSIKFPGHKSNMSCLNAAIGLEQLKKLDTNLETRKRLAAQYRRELSPFERTGKVRLQRIDASYDYEHGNCYFPIRVPNVAAFLSRVPKQSIFGYWSAMHTEPYYSNKLNYTRGDFPNAELAEKEVIFAPLLECLSNKDVNEILGAVKQGLR